MAFAAEEGCKKTMSGKIAVRIGGGNSAINIGKMLCNPAVRSWRAQSHRYGICCLRGLCGDDVCKIIETVFAAEKNCKKTVYGKVAVRIGHDNSAHQN